MRPVRFILTGSVCHCWNGTPYTYGDNTTVNMNQSQSMTYLGVTYTYKF